MRYGIYLARIEEHTTISPRGLLRSVQIRNKSYGPRDLDPKHQITQIRQGQLTAAQMNELARLFDDWDSLGGPYGGVPDGGQIEIRYGDQTVSGGSAVPGQVRDIHVHIRELASKMPLIEE